MILFTLLKLDERNRGLVLNVPRAYIFIIEVVNCRKVMGKNANVT